MKKFEECDGSCQNYCWPILTKRSVLGSLFFYLGFLFMLLSAIFIELSCMQHGIPPVLLYSPQFAFLFMVIVSVFRMKTLEKLISYYHPKSWVAKIFFIFFYLLIPYPEVRFLLEGKDNVIVRDISLSPRQFSLAALAQIINDSYPARCDDEESLIRVYPDDATCITIEVTERIMVLSLPVLKPVDSTLLESFECISLGTAPTTNQQALRLEGRVCYFWDQTELADNVLTKISELLSIKNQLMTQISIQS